MCRLLLKLIIVFLFLLTIINTAFATPLQITVDFKHEENRIVFFGKTNLPEGTHIEIALFKKGIFRTSDSVIVTKDGRFESKGFKERLVGEFELKLFSYFNTAWQKPPDLLKKLSTYRGPAIKDEGMEISKTIQIKAIEPLSDNRKLEINDLKGYLKRLKAMKSELENKARKGSNWDEWSAYWNRIINQERDNFKSRFGKTFREYKGDCRNAYYFILVGLGDLFPLWSEYDNIVTGRTTSRENIKMLQIQVEKDIEKAQDAINECSE